MKPRPRIRLVCHFGARSGPALAAHFLDHYYRLGVDCFLIILHEADDARTDAVLDELARYSAKPVLRVRDYSSRLMYMRYLAVVRAYCKLDDWVLYADADELQVYPDELHAFAANLEAQGRDFVTGRFVDRIAPDGDLAEIQSDVSIWAQFPCAARVTEQLMHGETRKVCMARASRPIGDGGAHTVRFTHRYGDNLRRTYASAWGAPPVEVHHFKWDASLVERLDNKLTGRGGDRDAAHGKGFIWQYRQLAQHVAMSGRVQVDGARSADTPSLCYERAALAEGNAGVLALEKPFARRCLDVPRHMANPPSPSVEVRRRW